MSRDEKVNQIIDERKFGVYYNYSFERLTLTLVLVASILALLVVETTSSILHLTRFEIITIAVLVILSIFIYEGFLSGLQMSLIEGTRTGDDTHDDWIILVSMGCLEGLFASAIFTFIPDSSIWLIVGFISVPVITLSCFHLFTLYTGTKITLERETLALEVNSRLDEIEKKKASHPTQSILEVPSKVACLHKADYLVLIDKFKKKNLVLSRESELCLLVIDDMNRMIDSSPLDENIEEAKKTKERAISALIDDLNHHEAIEQELLLIADANATLDKIISRKDD